MLVGTGWLLCSIIWNVCPNAVSPMISRAKHWNRIHRSTLPYPSALRVAWMSLSILRVKDFSVQPMKGSSELRYLMEKAGDTTRLCGEKNTYWINIIGAWICTVTEKCQETLLTLNLWNTLSRVLNIDCSMKPHVSQQGTDTFIYLLQTYYQGSHSWVLSWDHPWPESALPYPCLIH